MSKVSGIGISDSELIILPIMEILAFAGNISTNFIGLMISHQIRQNYRTAIKSIDHV